MTRPTHRLLTAAVTFLLLSTMTTALAAVVEPAPLLGGEDDFATAAVIDADAVQAFDPFYFTANTAFASTEPGEPVATCMTPGAPTIWFRWTPTTANTVQFSTAARTEYDATVETEMAIYSGDGLGSLVEEDCSAALRDEFHGADGRSRFYFNPTPGTTYHVQVATPTERGPVALTLRRPGPVGDNDTFANATPIDALPYDVDGGYLIGASTETGEPAPSCPMAPYTFNRTLWWKYTPTSSHRVTFDTTGSDADTVLAVYTGASVDTLSEVACSERNNAAHFGWKNGRVSVVASAGTTYWVQVTDQAGNGRPIRMQAWRTGPKPANDAFANAASVTSLPFAERIDLTRATGEVGEPACGNDASAWYELTPDHDMTVVVSTLDSPTDTEVGVYTGAAVDTLSELGCQDDFGWQFQERVTFPASAGVTYWILVGLNDTDERGPVEVSFAEAPPSEHDTFDTAAAITQVPFLGSSPTYRASEDTVCGTIGRPAWWTWTAPVDIPVWVSSLGTETDILALGVFSGDTEGTLTEIDCVDTASGYYDEMVTFDATAGTRYSFAIVTDSDGFAFEGPDDVVLQLQAGATVTGAVTEDASEAPLEGLCVEVRDDTGESVLATGTTDADGAYAVGGLATGDVTVAFNLCGEDASPDHVGEFHDDVPSDGAPTTVAVVAGRVTSGIDAALAAAPDPEPFLVRYAGEDRYLTAIEISKATFPDLPAAARAAAATDAQAVVIARGNEYADALAGAPLARAVEAPILLSRTEGLPDAVAAEVQRLGVTTAYLLGGQAALSDQVEADLAALGVATVERLGGDDRFDTAALVAEELADVLGASPGTAMVVEGINADVLRGWPDAVSAGAAAARRGIPILLTRAGSLPEATSDAISDGGLTSVTIVGGQAAVNDTVEAALVADLGDDAVDRLFGDDRYGTSTALASDELDALATTARVWVATGLAFPDALAAGPAVAARGDVLVLAHGKDETRAAATYAWLTDHAADIVGVRVVGGTGAVSEAVADRVVDLVQ